MECVLLVLAIVGSAMIFLLLFVLGTLVGSFLNVCIWRMPRGESVVAPPSHCPTCNTRLSLLDLFPLVSQLWLRGKCRYCGAKFSWRYAGIELLTGILFALVAIQPGNLSGGDSIFFASWTGDYVRLLRDLIFMSTLTVVFWVDYDTRLIQLESVLLMGLAGLGYEGYRAWQSADAKTILTDGKIIAGLIPSPVPEAILAAVITAGALWLLREAFSRLYGREAMGLGDVLLVAAIAPYLGWSALIITFLFLASVLGAFIGTAFQIPQALRSYRWAKARQKRYGGKNWAQPLARRSLRAAMPFGPMLAMGAVAALLFGTQINDAYLNLVLPKSATPIASIVHFWSGLTNLL